MPGEQAVLSNSGKGIVIRKVDPEIYCGWHEGRMIFRNNTLKEILRVLERRYDMDVIWTDESLKAVLFSGEMPMHERVETLLKIIGGYRWCQVHDKRQTYPPLQGGKLKKIRWRCILSFVLLVGAFIPVCGQTSVKRVTLNLQNAEMEEFIRQIKTQTGFTFFYNDSP